MTWIFFLLKKQKKRQGESTLLDNLAVEKIPISLQRFINYQLSYGLPFTKQGFSTRSLQQSRSGLRRVNSLLVEDNL